MLPSQMWCQRLLWPTNSYSVLCCFSASDNLYDLTIWMVCPMIQKLVCAFQKKKNMWEKLWKGLLSFYHVVSWIFEWMRKYLFKFESDSLLIWLAPRNELLDFSLFYMPATWGLVYFLTFAWLTRELIVGLSSERKCVVAFTVSHMFWSFFKFLRLEEFNLTL